MERTRRWKKALAALLALAALCGIMAVGAAALTIQGETPDYARPYVAVPAQGFAKQPLSKRPLPQSGARKVPTAQAYDMMMALLPLFVVKNHEKIWGMLPDAMLLREGAARGQMQKGYAEDIDALFKKNGWSKEITLDELFYSGKLPAYVQGVTAAYARAVAENYSPAAALTLLAWQFLFLQILPVDIALYIVLP